MINQYKDKKNEMVKRIAKLDTLSPLKTLTRGYVIAQKNGKVIKSVKEVQKDDEIAFRFMDGEKKAKVL